MNYLTRLIEAALFSAARPLSIGELRAVEPGTTPADVEAALDELRRRYDEAEHGIEVVELADGFQVLTRPELAEALTHARIAIRPRKLSVAAMETLAVIAYRQPVGRSEIEEIRGVASDGVLRLLQDRGLVDVAGRGEGLGRPLLYGTTPRFLEMIGLKDRSELPRLDELTVALRPLEGLSAGALGIENTSSEGMREGLGADEPAGDGVSGAPSAEQTSSEDGSEALGAEETSSEGVSRGRGAEEPAGDGVSGAPSAEEASSEDGSEAQGVEETSSEGVPQGRGVDEPAIDDGPEAPGSDEPSSEVVPETLGIEDPTREEVPEA